MVQDFIAFLFGSNGILTTKDGRIWVFISSFVLFSFFFRGYLLKGATGGMDKVSYALAFVFAVSMAREGASLGAVIQVAEVFFVMLFADALKSTVGDASKWTAWIIAIILVG